MKFDNMVILAVIVAIIILTMGAVVYTSGLDKTTNNITDVNNTNGTHKNDNGLLSIFNESQKTTSSSSSSQSQSQSQSSSSSQGSSSSGGSAGPAPPGYRFSPPVRSSS